MNFYFFKYEAFQSQDFFLVIAYNTHSVHIIKAVILLIQHFKKSVWYELLCLNPYFLMAIWNRLNHTRDNYFIKYKAFLNLHTKLGRACQLTIKLGQASKMEVIVVSNVMLTSPPKRLWPRKERVSTLGSTTWRQGYQINVKFNNRLVFGCVEQGVTR